MSGVDELEQPIESVTLAEGLMWEDGWFAVGAVDADKLAVGEPAYHQKNWSYLITDGGESLLFDTGSGRRTIGPLVARRAAASIRAFPSHMHFDHLGGVNAFGPATVADLPMLRAMAPEDMLTPTDEAHLGHYENLSPPSFPVGHWAGIGEVLQVGLRHLHVLHTPGHSPDSVSLWEPARNRLYAADLIYRGALYAQTPAASLPDYRETLETLLNMLPGDVEILGAHGQTEDGTDDMPRLGHEDLAALHEAVCTLLKGTPHDGERTINPHMTLLYSEASFAG
ncbi:MAG: MBL fold metallo-hydrolase [Roseovarius sp.]